MVGIENRINFHNLLQTEKKVIHFKSIYINLHNDTKLTTGESTASKCKQNSEWRRNEKGGMEWSGTEEKQPLPGTGNRKDWCFNQ